MSIYHAIDWMQGQVVGGVREYYDNVERVQKGLNWLGVPTDLYGIGRATGFNDWLGLDRPKSRGYSFTNNMPGTRTTSRRGSRRTGPYPAPVRTIRVRRKTTGKTRRAKNRRKSNKKKGGKELVKKIKGVVKSVMECAENTGTYSKRYTGEFEPYVNAGQKRISFSMTRNGTNTGPHFVNDMRYCMTRKKLLDAVSVLFNNKTRSANWNNGVLNFVIKGFKMDLLYASLDIKWINYTEWAFDCEIFEVVNKHNTDTSFLDDAKAMNEQVEWVGANPTFSTASTTQFDMDMGLEFGMMKGVAGKYSVKKVKTGRVYPGQTIGYFKKWGPQCIDLTKTLVINAGVGILPNFAKGDTQVFIRYTPVMHLHSSQTTHICTNLANAQQHDYGFLVDVQETFKFLQPAETDEVYGGDKRALLVDVPYEPSGVGPYVQKYMSTGPSYINLNNPKN